MNTISFDGNNIDNYQKKNYTIKFLVILFIILIVLLLYFYPKKQSLKTIGTESQQGLSTDLNSTKFSSLKKDILSNNKDSQKKSLAEFLSEKTIRHFTAKESLDQNDREFFEQYTKNKEITIEYIDQKPKIIKEKNISIIIFTKDMWDHSIEIPIKKYEKYMTLYSLIFEHFMNNIKDNMFSEKYLVNNYGVFLKINHSQPNQKILFQIYVTKNDL